MSAHSQHRVADFSDVHSNVEALTAVLDDIDRHGIEELWCLGDVIGNGHDPVACFDLVEERCSIVLAGNHEVVIAGDHVDLPSAALHSRTALLGAGGGRLDRLADRTSELRAAFALLAHGCPSPFDPVRSYLVEEVDPGEVLAALPDDELILVGHTHVAGEWRDGRRKLVNVGSVGEPRGGTMLPTWIELVKHGEEPLDVVWHHVAFDLERYRRNMDLTGLPLPPMWEPAVQYAKFDTWMDIGSSSSNGPDSR